MAYSLATETTHGSVLTFVLFLVHFVITLAVFCHVVWTTALRASDVIVWTSFLSLNVYAADTVHHPVGTSADNFSTTYANFDCWEVMCLA